SGSFHLSITLRGGDFCGLAGYPDATTYVIRATEMSFFSIRQCITYLLIALLPLQAAAASSLALCTETARQSSTVMPAMDDCAQMAMSPHSKAPVPHSHESKSCWLGSICLASLMGFAVPNNTH